MTTAGHPKASNGKLLIVEDDAATRFALAKILGFKGYEVVTASTLAAALIKCDEHTCVLLDLHLPDGLGLEVLKRMRQRCNGAKIAVCSAAHDPALHERVQRYKPDAVFIKPIDLDALLAWIANACGSTGPARHDGCHPHPPDRSSDDNPSARSF